MVRILQGLGKQVIDMYELKVGHNLRQMVRQRGSWKGNVQKQIEAGKQFGKKAYNNMLDITGNKENFILKKQ